MKNIVLIGFMGTGKSTVAKELGRLFQMQVLEMDDEIERREAMSIPDIFATYGEVYFRERETELLAELQKQPYRIVSCGGGTPLRECNVVQMKKNGRVIWLTASPETILNRVKADENRPLLKGNMNISYICNMMEQRKEKYELAADIIIDTEEKSVADICMEIKEKIREEETDV